MSVTRVKRIKFLYEDQKRKEFLEPPKCKVNAFSIAPEQLTTEVFVKLIIFNAFSHEILPLAAYDSRRLHEENHLNISVFIEQKNISFQNDISLKTTGLGVVRKVKTS